MKNSASRRFQRGRFMQGLIVGLLVGLILALGVALYVNKVPLPFVDKVPQRTAEQDAAEAESNKHWDPNAPLYGDNPAKPKAVPVPASAVVDSAASSAPAPAAVPTAAPAQAQPAAPAPASAPAADTPKAPDSSAKPKAPPVAADPAAILSDGAVSTEGRADALSYYVQAGAYSASAEAEQQRAKISMLGMEPSISQREVHGRTMYRVRLGPFNSPDEAEAARLSLAGNGIESALVRVQK